MSEGEPRTRPASGMWFSACVLVLLLPQIALNSMLAKGIFGRTPMAAVIGPLVAWSMLTIGATVMYVRLTVLRRTPINLYMIAFVLASGGVWVSYGALVRLLEVS